MKLATWNINSIRVRLPHVLTWLASSPVDILCLQELKLPDAMFPAEEVRAAGYHSAVFGQNTYNGVAILSREEPRDIAYNIPGFKDEQRRLIAATYPSARGDLRVVNVYCPNGQEVGSEKFDYKLRWFAALRDYLQEELTRHPQLVLLGDFNIAPEDRDVHDPAKWEGKVHVSAPEREAFRSLLGLGLHDAFRLFDQPEKSFSWWDYRMMAFRRNAGLRIDLILLSEALRPHCMACTIDKEPRRAQQPSDHAPVIATLDL